MSSLSNLQEEIDRILQDKKSQSSLDKFILWTVPVLAAAAVVASGWSLYSLGRHYHVPSYAAWTVFALIDLVWLHSAAVVIRYRTSPHRALDAHRRMNAMFAVSILANLGHGLVMSGTIINGVSAGLLFALFPVGFKAAFSNAFPDYVSRARKAGYKEQLKAAYNRETLNFIMSGLHVQKLEMDQVFSQAEFGPVSLEKLELSTQADMSRTLSRTSGQLGQLPGQRPDSVPDTADTVPGHVPGHDGQGPGHDGHGYGTDGPDQRGQRPGHAGQGPDMPRDHTDTRDNWTDSRDMSRDTEDRERDTRDTVPDMSQDTQDVVRDSVRDKEAERLALIAGSATGPSDLVRKLLENGVPQANVARIASQYRPDFKADSIRKTANRMINGYA